MFYFPRATSRYHHSVRTTHAAFIGMDIIHQHTSRSNDSNRMMFMFIFLRSRRVNRQSTKWMIFLSFIVSRPLLQGNTQHRSRQNGWTGFEKRGSRLSLDRPWEVHAGFFLFLSLNEIIILRLCQRFSTSFRMRPNWRVWHSNVDGRQ